MWARALSYFASSYFAQVTAFDTNHSMINYAQSHYQKGNLKFISSKFGQDTGLKSDVFIGSSILNVVRDPEEILALAMEATKAGGVSSFIQPSEDFQPVGVKSHCKTKELKRGEAFLLHLWQKNARKIDPKMLIDLFKAKKIQNIRIKYYFNTMLFSISGNLPKEHPPCLTH